MTDKKKIAESIEIRIALPEKYEHIIMTKYAEKEIVYDSVEEMEEKEANLNTELVNSLIHDMRALPGRLGKTTEAVQEVEERIKGKLPTWLKSEDVPNLANANMARKTHERSVDEQQSNKEKQDENIREAKEAVGEATDELTNDDELFENFDQNVDPISEEVEKPQDEPEKAVNEPTQTDQGVEDKEVTVPDTKDEFGDDWEEDLFGDNKEK